jgi:hypothetical protein
VQATREAAIESVQKQRAEESITMHSNREDQPEEPDFTPTYQEESHKRPYWKRAHLDWRVWVAAFFLFAAIAVYVWTVDLSIVPRV